MSAGLIKVGTLVMVIAGENAGKTAVVVSNDPGHRLTHEIEFPEPVTGFVGGWLSHPISSKRLWAERRHLIPLTPPGEPETLIEEAPVRDEVSA